MEKIDKILSVETFLYDPLILNKIRACLFEKDVDFRKRNIRRFENILGGRSCRYTDYHEIGQRIIEIFQQARARDIELVNEGADSVHKIIRHAVDFISQIWESHPYNDENTRISACLLILYLRYWEIYVTDDFFALYPNLFRESLVRACYSDEEIEADCSFAERFIHIAIDGGFSRDDVYSSFLI